MQLLNERTLELARKARQTGLFSIQDRDGCGNTSFGALRVAGPDAAEFLHAQITNEVKEVEEGRGNLSARVKRTGHLEFTFSLHRLPAEKEGSFEFLLILARTEVPALLESLDRFLFADQVELEDVSDEYDWVLLQGPATTEVLGALGMEAGEREWTELAPQDIVDVLSETLPAGTRVVARSFTGDRGFVLVVPRVEDPDGWQTALREAAAAADVIEPDANDRIGALDVLRVEAGIAFVGHDTPRRERLLPETGFEHQMVSYTKGCYLGQEVIARVRTYGSLPFGLRGLVLEHSEGATLDEGIALLERVPAVGEDVVLEDGTTVGQFVSRTFSPVREAPVVMAYLDRAHRTPGNRLVLQGAGGSFAATVALLPFYNAPDQGERVAHLYDRAVSIFAEGREEEAIGLLEEALRIDPGFSDGYEAIGVILGRAQKFHEAIDIFKRLEEVAPDEPMVNTNLSLYYMKLGDKQTAEDEAGKAMQKSILAGADGDPEALAEQERKMMEERREDARRKKEMFGQVLDIDPEDDVALYGLGSALSVLEEWSEAEAVFERACAVKKDNSALFLARGKALEKLDRFDDAREVYRQGMEVASRKGDLMPLKEMQHRALLLGGTAGVSEG